MQTAHCWRWLLLAAAVGGVALPWIAVAGQDKSEGKPQELRVLFLGNSQIFFNDLPRMLEGLADSATKEQPRIQASQVTPGGASLESLWNKGIDKGTARGRIVEEKWDYVVLQEHFNAKPESFNKHALLFHELIEKNGAKTVLFCTASISTLYPQGFESMHDMQVALGKKIDVPVAAAGQAWRTYWGKDSTPEQRLLLYDADKAHPGRKGSYLYACTLYAVLVNRTPVGLTHRLPKQPEGSLSEAEAKKMQEAAWETHQEMQGTRPAHRQ